MPQLGSLTTTLAAFNTYQRRDSIAWVAKEAIGVSISRCNILSLRFSNSTITTTLTLPSCRKISYRRGAMDPRPRCRSSDSNFPRPHSTWTPRHSCTHLGKSLNLIGSLVRDRWQDPPTFDHKWLKKTCKKRRVVSGRIPPSRGADWPPPDQWEGGRLVFHVEAPCGRVGHGGEGTTIFRGVDCAPTHRRPPTRTLRRPTDQHPNTTRSHSTPRGRPMMPTA